MYHDRHHRKWSYTQFLLGEILFVIFHINLKRRKFCTTPIVIMHNQYNMLSRLQSNYVWGQDCRANRRFLFLGDDQPDHLLQKTLHSQTTDKHAKSTLLNIQTNQKYVLFEKVEFDKKVNLSVDNCQFSYMQAYILLLRMIIVFLLNLKRRSLKTLIPKWQYRFTMLPS